MLNVELFCPTCRSNPIENFFWCLHSSNNIRFWFEKPSWWSLQSSKDRELTVYDHVQTLRIRFAPKRKEDIRLVKNDVIQQTNQYNVFFSNRSKTYLERLNMVYIPNKKATFNPLCLNIHFAEETINGSHITATTAKLRLCANYTPGLCNVFWNLLGNKLKKWFEFLWKGTKRMLYYVK